MTGYAYRVTTECDEMHVLVPEPKIALARKAARENGLRGEFVEYELLREAGTADQKPGAVNE